MKIAIKLLIFIALSLYLYMPAPALAQGTVTHEETQVGGSSNSTTISTSAPLVGIPGDLYLASIVTGVKGGSVPVVSVSGLGLTWTLVRAQCAGRDNVNIELWMAQGIPVGNDLVTATLASAPRSAGIAVSRYSGVHTINPIGNIVSGNTNGENGICSDGSDTDTYLFSLATGTNGNVVYSTVGNRNTDHTPGVGFTERAAVDEASGIRLFVQDKSPSASPTNVDGTYADKVFWAAIGVEIIPLTLTPGNQAPVVDAGAFQLIELNTTNTVAMNATASDDGIPNPPGQLIYEWSVSAFEIVIGPPEPPGPEPVFSPSPNVLNPTVTFPLDGLFNFRLIVKDGELVSFDEVQVLVNPEGLIPGPLENVPIPGPHNLAAFPPGPGTDDPKQISNQIDGVDVPYSEFVTDQAALVRLGKALFWDMQVGSDGVQACASCHFAAGADSRFINQLNPGQKGNDDTFQIGPPNHTLTISDFPYHKLTDPDNRFSTVISDANDVSSSMGVIGSNFVDIIPGNDVDDFTNILPNDAPFNTGLFDVRRVEPRNTPSAINAVFNFRNFWDGRAFNNFNGVNPFGNRDTEARIVKDTDGIGGSVATAVQICLPLSSLASQAVGPPLSGFEMSAGGRIWPKVGKKILNLPPLAKQIVATDDSELGTLSNDIGGLGITPGISTTYAQMIMDAFNSQWWSSDNIITYSTAPNGTPVPTVGATGAPVGTDEYTVMEANFSFFFGLAVQAYEATLVSDDAPFDQFRKGNLGALNPSAQRGLQIFTNIGLNPTVPAGFCIACHTGPEFTAASVGLIGQVEPPNPLEPVAAPEIVMERMAMAFGEAKASLTFVANAVLPPAPGVVELPLNFDPRGKLIEIKDAGIGTLLFSGTFPVGDPANTPFPPTPPNCVPELIIALLTPTPDAPPLPALAEAELLITGPPECATEFGVAIIDMPIGFYDFFVDGILRGTMEVTNLALYDIGFYNIGVRPTAEDIGNGGMDPFGNPLSLAQMEFDQPGRADVRKGIPGGGLGGGFELIPPAGSVGEFIAKEGTFKTPGLRNAELTGPYFHNGGQGTLRQVLDFYNRGADFSDLNIATLDPEILPLGFTAQDKTDVVAFILSLTDNRVRIQSAPFDHPQLFVPNGHDPITGADNLVEIPAVGASGGPPLMPFLQGDPFLPKDVDLASNDGVNTVPAEFNLEQNFPNPFNPRTTIQFAVPEKSYVRLEIFSLLGQKVRSLVNDNLEPGVHTVNWDGKNDTGVQVGSGVYFYRLQTPNFTRTKRMLMIK